MWTLKNQNLKATDPNGRLPGTPTTFAFTEDRVHAVQNYKDASSTAHMYIVAARRGH